MISFSYSVHVLHCIGHAIFDVVSIISFVDIISILNVVIIVVLSFFKSSSSLSSVKSTPPELNAISSKLELVSLVILFISQFISDTI